MTLTGTEAPITVTLSIHQLESGNHICRKTIAKLSEVEITLPYNECLMPILREEDNCYWPEINLRRIESSLRKRGHFGFLPSDQCYFFGVRN